MSVMPTAEYSRKRVSHSAVTGTSSSATETTTSARRMGAVSWAMAKPAVDATSSDSGTADEPPPAASSRGTARTAAA